MNSGSPTMGHHANWWEDPFAPQDDPTECSWEEMNSTIRSYRRVALDEPEDIFAQVRREDGICARVCLLWCHRVSAAVVRLRRLPGRCLGSCGACCSGWSLLWSLRLWNLVFACVRLCVCV